ncbi:hypothetical protein PHLGIDRAFT_124897 [Phlebiopsis gigantea 11061_1 CR5-6]|uniref:Peptidase S1 domain-containing protein n=1 Tax=Phlebiopsis gigantea (strain 11061_1 CR5-6) TaxID=745531 RepID=A0A0C3SD49_PHLG1|nr:hypothetical protein PHLGIDRAFT_124897 [Phlebiopsis gigantea 11061_1 CR5-6]
MALRLVLRRPTLRAIAPAVCPRSYATVHPGTFAGEPPEIPENNKAAPGPAAAPTALDALILSELRRMPSASIPSLVRQFDDNAGKVLSVALPYESRPGAERRVRFEENDHSVLMVAHAAQDADRHKVSVCSGFALNVPAEGEESRSVLLTCAHTLQEMRRSPLLSPVLNDTAKITDALLRSGTYVVSQAPGKHVPSFHPVRAIQSSLPRPDLVVLSADSVVNPPIAHTLPISPYPAYPGTTIRAHFVVVTEPAEGGWHPWVGGLWSKWVRGTVLGYRDYAGREAQPGTYDALSHLLFEPLPTPGSSGGPIVDEESGAVVGVILGTRMDNRVGGVRGWGVPAEMVYEMFSLPGLELKYKA